MRRQLVLAVVLCCGSRLWALDGADIPPTIAPIDPELAPNTSSALATSLSARTAPPLVLPAEMPANGSTHSIPPSVAETSRRQAAAAASLEASVEGLLNPGDPQSRGNVLDQLYVGAPSGARRPIDTADNADTRDSADSDSQALKMLGADGIEKYSLPSTSLHRAIASRVSDFKAYALTEYGHKAFHDADTARDAASQARDDAALSFLGRLKRLGPGYEQLIVDPGLLQHLDGFEIFMKAHQMPDPWRARDIYAGQDSNRVTVYRGMALSHQEAQRITQSGIESSLQRELSAGQIANQRYFVRSLCCGLRNHLGLHEEWALTGGSPFISVTSHPEVAVAVARRFATADKEIHLFEIALSAIDLINIAPGNGLWEIGTNYTKRLRLHNAVQPDRVVTSDWRTESFAFLRIPAANVKEVPPPPDAAYSFE